MPKVDQQHLDARRHEILEAATTCFARSGIAATTIQDICRESGLSPGAIYRYFKGKDDILEAVFASHRAEQGERYDAIRRSPDPLVTLRAMASGMFQLLEDPSLARDQRLSQLIHAEAIRDPAIAADYARLHRQVAEQIGGVLEEARQQGRIRADADPEYVAWTMNALYQGFRTMKLIDPELDTARFAKVASRVFQFLLED